MNLNYQKPDELTGWALHAVGGLLIMLVVGASYVFGFNQFASQHESHAARTEQLNTLLQTAAEVHKQHQLQQEEFDQLNELATTMRSRLPSSPEKKPFETKLKELAKQVDLDLQKIKWSSAISEETYFSIEATVSGSGSYASICKFLNEVSQLTRITKVSKLHIETRQVPASYPFNVTFTLVYGVQSHDTQERGGAL